MVELPTTPTFNLNGRRALVTGASSGIGLAGAVALAEAGADVVAVARGAERLADAQSAMSSAGLSVTSAILDVSDISATEKFLQENPPFDFVLNAAGMARNLPWSKVVTDDFDDVFAINVRGAYFLSTAFARRLIETERTGSILHVSSQMGHVGGIDRSVYCASKHALEGMTKALAIEFGPKQIRINTIAPTFIRTPLTAPTFANPERVAWILSKIHLGRVGEVEDIMGPVVFFASDASALITGTSLLVDGGWTAD